MKREFLNSILVEGKALPKEVVDAIMAENGKDIQTHKAQAESWQQQFETLQAKHDRELQELTFQGKLSEAVRACGGRNVKAIGALLDLESLKNGDDTALEQALQSLKKEHGYLFCQSVPVPYAPGTGTSGPEDRAPETLAGALRQRFLK